MESWGAWARIKRSSYRGLRGAEAQLCILFEGQLCCRCASGSYFIEGWARVEQIARHQLEGARHCHSMGKGRIYIVSDHPQAFELVG